MPAAERPDLRNADLCFLDLEATGHVFGFHEVIDVAVIRTSPDTKIVKGTWRRRLRPLHPERITPKAQEITHFDAGSWSDAEMSSVETWTAFADFCRGCVPVCHNPTFDRAYVTLAAAAAGVTDLGVDYHWIGTESLAWPLYKSGAIERLSLEDLCSFFGISPEPFPHTAANGAELCRQVYRALMSL